MSRTQLPDTATTDPRNLTMDHRPYSQHLFSKCYRGFTVQQTEQGWVILNFPNWASYGPVNQGPFSTYQIACMQVDRVLNARP